MNKKHTLTLLTALLLAPLAALHAKKKDAVSSKAWNSPRRLFPSTGESWCDGFQRLELTNQ
jgi:hypothetical protein